MDAKGFQHAKENSMPHHSITTTRKISVGYFAHCHHLAILIFRVNSKHDIRDDTTPYIVEVLNKSFGTLLAKI